MKITKRLKIAIVCFLLLVVLAISNMLMIGRAFANHYDWECDQCQVRLYRNPGKNQNSMDVPATYEVHQHSWRLTNQPTRWSPWKPWHWMICFEAEPEFLMEPNPQTLFESAPLDSNSFHEVGKIVWKSHESSNPK